VTLTFLLVLVDTAIDCSPRASLNFVEFIWHNIKTFAFIKYAIACTPLETPKFCFSAITVRLATVGELLIYAQLAAEIAHLPSDVS